MPQKLLNKVAVITGAGSGIGRAIAEHFLHEGAKVVAFGRNRPCLEEVAASAPARALVVEGDVTRNGDLQQLVEATRRRFGGVDVVVPNAGLARFAPFAESPPEVLREQFDVNFWGAAETVRALLPHLNDGAAIVFVTACFTETACRGLAGYSASKAALKALAQTLAVELAPRRIRVNCIAPGPIATPFWEKAAMSSQQLKQQAEQFKARMLSNEFGHPDDVAETAVFLASDAARHIHGQEVTVDGGYTTG